MPYHTNWTPVLIGGFDWPPNLLPAYGVIAGGNLALPIAPLGGGRVMQPDGWIDVIVENTDGTVADLTVTDRR